MTRILTLVLGLAVTATTLTGQRGPSFAVDEATIGRIHEAMRARQLTCRALVGAYLQRIDAYDKRGPAINAIVIANPNAATEADDLDRRFARSGPVGPLHCIPAIVKDNFETIGMQSANGSLSLQGFVSDKDAFQVRQIKAAGAIVLAKSNMAEFAFSPYETVSSILPGYTRNPYALERVTAGSSGGTAAAVAASFGAIGLGSDTGNSIRGPSSHQALVGIRSTMGLTSRGGVAPLNLLADIAGPITRTVEDAVKLFQVVVGEDPADPATAASRGRQVPNYAASLVRNGLAGARIGILRQAYERSTADAEILKVFAKALEDIYPTWSNPPRLIGDLNTPDGDNSQVFSPRSGFPAINVPMGYTRNGTLPAGVTFLGRAWDEATLIKLAYSYEQSTHHRHPPAATPPIKGRGPGL